ncbi:MAG: xanthine dehydrogenase family protein molybdopterin-binding subunit [Aigarchaeota archaeon]|nr:xanthine dehydrogenase family protein molybdopterin-binding subunit [Aigarchaeota archaeon]
MQEVHTKWVGKPVERFEDVRFTSGLGTYIDDIELPGMLYGGILMSPYAHAKIKSIDVSDALKDPNVVAVITGKEVKEKTKLVRPRAVRQVEQYVMAVDKAIFVGQPVAAIAVTDRYAVEDALELIRVEYEPLKPVVEIEDALDPNSPRIFEELNSNIIMEDRLIFGDVDGDFRRADVVVRERFRLHRFSSTPLETFGVIASYDPGWGELTVYANDQQPGRSIANLSYMLDIPTNRIRFVIPDVGGGFGIKLIVWPFEVIMSLLSIKTGRPVKWIQTRTEHLTAWTHTPDAMIDVEMALKRDGEILSIKVRDVENDGTFIHTTGLYSMIKFATICGCYKIKSVQFEPVSVVTNKGPVVQNRGVGKPGMIYVLERTVDIAAKALNMDPAEIRFRNFIQPNDFPYTTPSGEVYDSGDYPALLRRALEAVNYQQFRREQAELRAKGRYLGIGISASIEPGTSNIGYYYITRMKEGKEPDFYGADEGASVSVEPDGKVRVVLGSMDIGTGHETVARQVVADVLGVSPNDVYVMPGFDSRTSPYVGYSGTFSNKFHDVDVGAMIGAARLVREKILKIASHLLEISEEDLEISDGRVSVRGIPDKSLTFAQIAAIAYNKVLSLPPGMEPGLRATYVYKSPHCKIPRRDHFNVQVPKSSSVHIAIVEVDVHTGSVKILRYVIVHDCGNMINPKIVEGLIEGATLHGIAAVMMEEFVHNEEGQNVTATFADYLKPSTTESIKYEIYHHTTPSPFTPLGSKPVGEGGAIASMPAVVNAVEDALSPFGVRIRQLPLTPDRVLRLIEEARTKVSK